MHHDHESCPIGPLLDPRSTPSLPGWKRHAASPRTAALATRRTCRSPTSTPTTGSPCIPEQGDLIYLLCRAIRATRVAEFATSVGMSALYFAAAMRDNGGGTVIGSELVPEKVNAARRNLAEAGLTDLVDLREGDAGRRCAIWAGRLTSCSSTVGLAGRVFAGAAGHGNGRAADSHRRAPDE